MRILYLMCGICGTGGVILITLKDIILYFFKEPLEFLYPCVYPIVIAIVILLEFLLKKVNKLSIILNYVLITVLFGFNYFYALYIFSQG